MESKESAGNTVFQEYQQRVRCLQDVGMKLATLGFGLWLAGASGFSAQTCCSQMVSPRASCGNCDDSSHGEKSPRPDCCSSLEAQKDMALVVAKADLSEYPVVITLLPVTPAFAPWHPEATDLVAEQSASLAEGPPLYLRNEVFLI